MRTVVLILFAVWGLERDSLWKEGISLWKDSVEKHPLAARPHNNLGHAYVLAGDLQSAEKEFYVALFLNNKYADALNNLASIRSKLGRYKESVDLFKTALQISPDNLGYRFNLALTYDDLGMVAQAMKEYKNIIELDPCNWEAHVQIGKHRERQGRRKEAEEEYGIAKRCYPEAKIP